MVSISVSTSPVHFTKSTLYSNVLQKPTWNLMGINSRLHVLRNMGSSCHSCQVIFHRSPEFVVDFAATYYVTLSMAWPCSSSKCSLYVTLGSLYCFLNIGICKNGLPIIEP